MVGPEQSVGSPVDVARLVLLRDIGRAFSSSLDLEKVFELVLEKAMLLLTAEAASLWLVAEPSKELHCETAIGPVSEKVRGLRLAWGTGIVGWVSQHGKPVIVGDAQQDKFLDRKVDQGTGFLTTSMICAPMVVRGKCLGAIQIVNKVKQNERFSKDDLELLVDLAIDAAIAVENARLYQAESKVKELHALLKISREIVSTLDLDRILATLVNILSTVVMYDRCTAALLDEGTLKLNAVSGMAQLDHKDPVLKGLEEFLRGLGDQEAMYLVRPDGQNDVVDRFAKGSSNSGRASTFMESIGLKSVLVLPLRDEEGLVGILSLESRTPDAFSETQFEILSILGAQATVAIRNAQLYRQVPTFNLRGISSILSPKALNRRRLAVIGTAVLATAGLNFVQMPLTLSGPAEVLAAEQIKIVAREGGTVTRVLVEEGSIVQPGQLLAELDDADLRLRLDGVRTDQTMARLKLRQLRLNSDAGALAIETIRADQALKEAANLQIKVQETQLRATMPGVVVTPRLSEKVGTKLSRGDVLLEIARLAELAVDIRVSEADVGAIRTSQPVALRLLAFPTQVFHGAVQLISPLGVKGPSESTFTVRARVSIAGAEIRSGMQGTARIEAGRRRVLDVLFRGLVAWAQLAWWKAIP